MFNQQTDEQVPLAQALERFRRSKAQGMWRYIAKEPLIDEIEATVADAFRIRHHTAVLSGSAAIVFELVRRQPASYVTLCQELYESGAFHTHNQLIEPTPQLRKSRIPAAMRLVDWMLLTTLRDVEDKLFGTTADEVVFGISTPQAMCGWVSTLLRLQKPTFVSTVVYGAFEALHQAKHSVKQGGSVLMLVDVTIFQTQQSPVQQPNHWLCYLGDSQQPASPDNLSLTCYSWGRRHQLQLTHTKFEENVLGILWTT